MNVYDRAINFMKNNRCSFHENLTFYNADIKNDKVHITCEEFDKCKHKFKNKNNPCKQVI